MSETMIERMARAIDPRAWENWDAWVSFKQLTKEEAAEEFARSQTLQLSLARAEDGFKAIREPTRDMTMAACDALPCVDGVFGHAGTLSANVWRKMIDSALSQSPSSLPTPAATPTDSANPPPVESVGPNSEAQP